VNIRNQHTNTTAEVMCRGQRLESRKVLGWQPKTLFKDLVRIMVEAEMEKVEVVLN